jgi:hypothetical protein
MLLVYSLARSPPASRWGSTSEEVSPVKKVLGLFGLIGAIGALVMFFRKKRDDDEFLDEELD